MWKTCEMQDGTFAAIEVIEGVVIGGRSGFNYMSEAQEFIDEIETLNNAGDNRDSFGVLKPNNHGRISPAPK